MTNPLLNNNIATESVILWQYDKAYNLIRLIQAWNKFAKVSCTDFWNYFGNSIFPIDRADTFGLNAWGNMLGITRPIIHIPKYINDDPSSGSYDGKINTMTNPKWLEVESSDTEAINEALSNGYIILKKGTSKIILYKPIEGFDVYGYSADGYRVIDDGIVYDDNGEIVSDSLCKTVTITNTLYRGLLKARFFMMCHKPTVPNYNKFLTILFGALDNNAEVEYDTTKIFNSYGVANVDDEGEPLPEQEQYTSRSKVLDFQNMTMGFTFPIDATVEEAYLIFQHYDVVYPFPAGIRYPGEFIYDDLVIGLNTNQESGENEKNQYYKNFVEGLVLAEDPEPANPNGGIFSTTDRANYKVPPNVKGKAYIHKIEDTDSDDLSDSDDSSDIGVSVLFTITNISDKRQAVWVDWGNGNCNYYFVPAHNTKSVSSTYETSGVYAIVILNVPDDGLTYTAPSGGVYITEYDLR